MWNSEISNFQIRILLLGRVWDMVEMAEKPTKVATIPMVMQTEFLEVGKWGWICHHK
jgi:hypothetical protein